MAQFPRQDIPESQKQGTAWYKPHLDYAESLLKSEGATGLRTRITELMNSYNGVKKPGSMAWLERTYGKQNRSKYVAYRIGRTKISLLHGEFLKWPLAATVTTINSEAKFEKMKQLDIATGAMLAKKELEELRAKAGVDVMEGAPIPENEDDPIWEKMSPKDQAEDVMQLILDEQVKSLDVKKKLGDCFLKVLITGGCFFETSINEEGEVACQEVDLRDAIFEEIEGDDYLQRSPIMGSRKRLPVHEILLRYNLTEQERNILDQARKSPQDYINRSNGAMRMSNGELLCDVIHIEWKSVKAKYFKKSPKTKNQMMISEPGNDTVELAMDPTSYEGSKDIHEKNIASGKYKVTTVYAKTCYEATRIGGLIDVNCREKYFQHRDADNPTEVLNSTYTGFLCGTVDGRRVSLQQVVQNFDNLYDVVMYQAGRDIARAKGKAMFYDRAGLPEGRSMKDVMFAVTNDGYVDWNSAASGNYSQKNLDMAAAIKEVDLGLSNSFEYLMNMADRIVNSLNQITGINENRQGDIAASSTASNANSAINASRTITEPIYFGFNGFIEKVLQNIVDTSAVSWAFYKLEKGDQILGTKRHKFLQATKEIGFRNYGLHIENGSRYAEMKQVMNQAMEISLNAKELRPIDYYRVNMAETLAQAKSILENSWMEMQAAIQKSNQEQNRVMQEIEAAKLKQQVELANADREDRQGSDKEKILLQGDVDIKVNREKSRNKIVEQGHQAQNEITLNQ